MSEGFWSGAGTARGLAGGNACVGSSGDPPVQPSEGAAVRNWSALAGSIARGPMAAAGTGHHSGWRHWHGTEMLAPSRVSSQQSTEKPLCLWISPVPFLPWDCSLSPQRHCVILRRGRREKSEGWATAWAYSEGQGPGRN